MVLTLGSQQVHPGWSALPGLSLPSCGRACSGIRALSQGGQLPAHSGRGLWAGQIHITDLHFRILGGQLSLCSPPQQGWESLEFEALALACGSQRSMTDVGISPGPYGDTGC